MSCTSVFTSSPLYSIPRIDHSGFGSLYTSPLCSACQGDLMVPRIRTVLASVPEFPVVGLLAWKCLQSEMKTSLTLGQFSTRLKTEMYLRNYASNCYYLCETNFVSELKVYVAQAMCGMISNLVLLIILSLIFLTR